MARADSGPILGVLFGPPVNPFLVDALKDGPAIGHSYAFTGSSLTKGPRNAQIAPK